MIPASRATSSTSPLASRRSDDQRQRRRLHPDQAAGPRRPQRRPPWPRRRPSGSLRCSSKCVSSPMLAAPHFVQFILNVFYELSSASARGRRVSWKSAGIGSSGSAIGSPDGRMRSRAGVCGKVPEGRQPDALAASGRDARPAAAARAARSARASSRPVGGRRRPIRPVRRPSSS